VSRLRVQYASDSWRHLVPAQGMFQIHGEVALHSLARESLPHAPIRRPAPANHSVDGRREAASPPHTWLYCTVPIPTVLCSYCMATRRPVQGRSRPSNRCRVGLHGRCPLISAFQAGGDVPLPLPRVPFR
jgi:hypothetical protein